MCILELLHLDRRSLYETLTEYMFIFIPPQVFGVPQRRPYSQQVRDLADHAWRYADEEIVTREAWIQAKDEAMWEASWAAFDGSSAEMTARAAERASTGSALVSLLARTDDVSRARRVIADERVYDSGLPEGCDMREFERIVIQHRFDVPAALGFAWRHFG